MTLIENWRKAHRMISVQAMSLAGALQGAWVFIPDDMRASIQPGVVNKITIALLALGVAGRLIKQDATEPK